MPCGSPTGPLPSGVPSSLPFTSAAASCEAFDEDDAIAAPCDAVDGFAVPTTEPTALAFVELSAFAAAFAAAFDELAGSVSAFCVTFDDAVVN